MPTRVVHINDQAVSDAIDLSPRRNLPGGNDNGTYLIFWQHGVSVGHAWLPAQESVLSVRQIQRLSRGDFELHVRPRSDDPDFPWPDINLYETRQSEVQSWESGGGRDADLTQESDATPHDSIGIIICTLGRLPELKHCLESIKATTPRAEEVIVVDNSATSAAVADICQEFDFVRLVREPVRGLSAARNRGIDVASSDILAFTDDDATVPPNWVQQLRRVFAQTSADVVTGTVLPLSLDTVSQDMFQFVYRIFDKGFEPASYTADFLDAYLPDAAPVWEIGAGVNMAVRRDVFSKVGKFDDLLGAGRAGVGEDSELWFRCLANGLTCRFAPNVTMFHSHRETMRDLHRQIFLYWRGHVVTLLRQFEHSNRPEQLHRARNILPRHTLSGLRRAVRRGEMRTAWLRITELRGLAAGWVYYRRHR